MIPRTLVPVDARPPASNGVEPSTRRRPTSMDERTLVPAMLPIVVLDGHSSIPTNLPLDSISKRVVVPRDINREAYGVVEDRSMPAQPSDLDERVTVPLGSQLPEIVPPAEFTPPDIVEPDLFTTGEVHLVPEQPQQSRYRWEIVVGAVAFHVLLILAIIYAPTHVASPAEQEIARKQLSVILPPGAFELNQPRTPAPPAVHVRVDPREIAKVAPPAPKPAPTKIPEVPRELPAAPQPKANVAETPAADAPAPKVELPRQTLKLETPDAPIPNPHLTLPQSATSGQSLNDLLHSGERPAGPKAIVGGGPIHSGGLGRRAGGGNAYGGLEMLTPDEGVDFSGYLLRVYYTVRGNWYAVMPGSVELGEKGIVQLTFRINRDGSVPASDPLIGVKSGKEPLDRAAYSSIRASNPFESLPPQFSGPFIELRYTYYYNILPNSVGQ